jgi:hypothetical protein
MNVNEIAFGVEIETHVPRGTTPVGGYHCGVQVPCLPTGWKAERDSSINARFDPECVEAVKAFRREKPWRGTIEDRKAKFQRLHTALCVAYRIGPAPALDFVGLRENCRHGDGGYDRTGNRIILAGKLSVVTYFFAFAAARGMSAYDCHKFSINLFAKMFPIPAAGGTIGASGYAFHPDEGRPGEMP